MEIGRQTVGRDQHIVQGVLGLGEVGEGVVAAAERLSIFPTDGKLRLAVLHLADIDDMVATEEQQVYLHPRPL